MTPEEISRTLRKAIETYGISAQVDVAIEEMAELTQALIHDRRGRLSNIPEEIADVEIMLQQLKMYFNIIEDTEKIKLQKIQRLVLLLERSE